MDCSEYQRWVAADVDGVLGSERERTEAHLASCPTCREVRASQGAVRDLLRSKSLLVNAPHGLRTRIRAHLDETSRGAGWLPLRWLGLAGAVAAAILAVVMLPRTDPAIDPLVEIYESIEADPTEVARRTDDAADLERYFAERENLGFTPTVLDLRPSGFRLVGGSVEAREGSKSRVAVYRDDDSLVVCDRRHVDDFPGGATEGQRFFERDGVSFCVTRHGPEVCCLMSRLPLDEFRTRLAATFGRRHEHEPDGQLFLAAVRELR